MMNGTMNGIVVCSLSAGWIGMLGGILSGAVIGLQFHKPGWLGGYDSFPRRLVRLGHIAFFGIGLLQLCYGFSLAALTLPDDRLARVGFIAFVIAQIGMPLFCFLTAWRPKFRHGFPIPVLAASVGVVCILRLLAAGN